MTVGARRVTILAAGGFLAAVAAVSIDTVLPTTSPDLQPIASPVPPTLDVELSDAVFVLLVPNVGEDAAIAAIDPITGAVLWSQETGVDPAAWLSRDSRNLTIASGLDASSNLQTVEIASGRAGSLHPLPDRWRNTLPSYFPTMAAPSNDGRVSEHE
jgi:hypothetical protein